MCNYYLASNDFSNNNGTAESKGGVSFRPDGSQPFVGSDQPATAHIEVPNPSVGEAALTAVPKSIAQPRVEDDLAAVLSRPVLVSSVNFPLTMATSVAVSTGMLATFLNNAAVSSRLAYVRHIKFTMCARLEMPANPHNYGEAFCALMPIPVSGNGAFTAPRFYQQPVSGIFNANTGNPVVLKYPFFWPRKKLPTDPAAADVQNYNQLIVAPLSPLGRDDAVAVGTPAMNIYIWLEDVEVSDTSPFITYSSARRKPQGDALRTRHAAPLEYSPGVISNSANKFAAWARQKLPLMPETVMAIDVADSVGRLAAWMGWSKPNAPNMVDPVLPRHTGYMAQGIGRGNATVLALDPAIGRAVNPGVGSEAEDVLAFEYWARKWGWIGQATYATTTTAGSVLAAIPVTPLVYDVASTTLAPVAMCALASERWVGAMEYRVTIAATPYHRGKLMLAYLPSTTTTGALSLTQLLTTTHNVVFDVSQATDVTVVVGWTQNTNCAVVWATGYTPDLAHSNLPDAVSGPVGPIFGSFLTSASLKETNGQLLLVAFDPLSTSAAGSLAVNLWARGGSDLQFSGTGSTSLSQAVAFSGEHRGVAHDFDQVAPQQNDTPMGYWLGGGPIDPQHSTDLWGDQSLSFRPLIKRMFPVYTFCPWATTSTSITTAVSQLWLKMGLPAYPPVVRTTNAGNFMGMGSATNTVNGIYYPNPISLLASAFAGMGGSMNHHIAVEPYGPLGGVNVMVAATQADTLGAGYGGNTYYPIRYNTTTSRWGDSWPGTAASTLFRWVAGMEWGRVSLAGGGILTLLEVQTKHPEEGAFVLPNSSTSGNQAPYGFELNVAAPAGAGLRGTSLIVSMAAGEDFNYFGFLGAPRFAAISSGGANFTPL